MHKTLLCLLVAASLGACSSSDDGAPADPAAPGADPITGAASGPVGGGPTEAASASGTPGVSDGTSPAQDGVPPARDGAPSVPGAAASDEDATASAPAVASAPGASDLIDEASYDALVREAFAIYTGRAYGAGVLALPPYPGLRGLPTATPEGETAVEEACENGGTARLAMAWSGARVIVYERRAAFDGCQSGAITLDGEIELLDNDNASVVSSGLTVDDGTTARTFSGGAAYGDGNNYGGSNRRWWTASELGWSWNDGTGEVRLENASTAFETTVPVTYSLRGDFTLTSAATGDRPLVATIPVPFELSRQISFEPDFVPDEWDFPVGTLRLEAADGSAVTVDADNGDDSSVRVTLDGSAGRSSFDRPWSDWNAALRAGPSPTP